MSVFELAVLLPFMNKLVHLVAQDILMGVNIIVERNIAFAKLPIWIVVAQVVAHWTKDQEVPNSIHAGS